MPDNNGTRSPLKTRILAIILLTVSLASAAWTSFQLRQALAAEHQLRGIMADLALVASTAPNHPSSRTVTTGEASLTNELNEVLRSGHHDEAWLGLEAVGLLAGLLLLRRTD